MKDKCGIVGIYSTKKKDDVSSLIYYGLYALQHRGQESAGIATYNQNFGLNIHCGMGLLTDVFDHNELNKLSGTVGIGHVRYSTTGQSKIENCQPFVTEFDDGFMAVAHNGDIVNSYRIRKELSEEGYKFKSDSDSDSEVLCYIIKREYAKTNNLIDALENVCKELVGSYSLTLLINDELYVIRDPRGIKPLIIGKKEDMYIAASETVALDVMNAELIRDVEPGEVIYFKDGEMKNHKLKVAGEYDLARCMFEYVYFARPDSIIDGKTVYEVRKNIGTKLYEEYPIDADIVMPVPDSSIPAAIGYSRASGIPYGEGLIKNRYVGRTFIMPTQEEREMAVKLKNNPLKCELEGKKIVLIDDSIVRGTTSASLIRVLKESGAKEVHLMIGCPPVISPCYYGVAMATKKELMAANKTVEEIREQIGAETLGYLSVDNLIEAIGFPRNTLCLGCITEEYPTCIPDTATAESYYKF